MIKKFRFDYTGDVQTIEIPKNIKSIYIEAYGSCGGTAGFGSYTANRTNYGNGGMACGTYTFKNESEKKLYIYVGGNTSTFNGGGKAIGQNYRYGGYGGGASDVRLIKASESSWYDEAHASWGEDKSLLSRIIVAGGGSGASGTERFLTPGKGGGLSGTDGARTYNTGTIGKGGTQTSGGAGGNPGVFGKGGDCIYEWEQGGDQVSGSGGGGWYGGGSGKLNATGGGGSSYINLLSQNDRDTEASANSSTGYVIISYFDANVIVDYEYSGQISQFVVQEKGIYKIECWGASGGGPNRELSGLGAYSRSMALLEKGDILKILTAGKGEWDDSRGGGGGGSFVELQPGKSISDATLLCAAGGGGGSMFSRQPNNYSHGQAGLYASNYNLTGFLTGLCTAGRSNLATGSGGAGYIYNSATSYSSVPSFCDPLIVGAASFKNGGKGGYGVGGRNNGGYFHTEASTPKGGFGGGGCSSYYQGIGNAGGTYGYIYNGAGGGGGYSGGDCTRDGYANTAGGGSSYFLSFKNYSKSYSLSGYENMPQIDGSIAIGNFGNGYVRITLASNRLYFLIKDNKNYLPKYDYFDTKNNKFRDLTYKELLNIYKESEKHYTYLNINDTFEKDGMSITPTDYIDFKECKLGVISDNNISEDNIHYIPSETNLSKTNIKLKEQIKNISYKSYIDIESPDKSYLEYITSYNNGYKNCGILDTEIFKNFSYLTFRFNNPNGSMSKILMNEYIDLKLIDIENKYFECESNLLNTSVKMKKDFDKILINKLTKQKFKYSNDTLETF